MFGDNSQNMAPNADSNKPKYEPAITYTPASRPDVAQRHLSDLNRTIQQLQGERDAFPEGSLQRAQWEQMIGQLGATATGIQSGLDNPTDARVNPPVVWDQQDLAVRYRGEE